MNRLPTLIKRFRIEGTLAHLHWIDAGLLESAMIDAGYTRCLGPGVLIHPVLLNLATELGG